MEVLVFNGHHLSDYFLSCFLFQTSGTASQFFSTLHSLSSKPHLPLIPCHKMFPSSRFLFLCVLGAQPFPFLSAHQAVSHSCGLDDGSRQRAGMNVSWRRNGAQVDGLGLMPWQSCAPTFPVLPFLFGGEGESEKSGSEGKKKQPGYNSQTMCVRKEIMTPMAQHWGMTWP